MAGDVDVVLHTDPGAIEWALLGWVVVTAGGNNDLSADSRMCIIDRCEGAEGLALPMAFCLHPLSVGKRVTYSPGLSGEGLKDVMKHPLKSQYILHGCQVLPRVNTYGPGATVCSASPATNIGGSARSFVSSSRAPGSMRRSYCLAPNKTTLE